MEFEIEHEEAQPLIAKQAAVRSKLGKGAILAIATLAFVGVAGPSLLKSRATTTHLQASGGTHSAMSLTVKSGNYEDAPGNGYAKVDQTRFAEPHRATTFTLASAQGAAAITSCAWSTKTARPDEAGGPWDDIVGVEAAATFERSGRSFAVAARSGDLVLSGDSAGHSFDVTYPSPGTWAVSISCDLADGTTATLENEEIGVYYVRRELRELSVADKELFLDTFVTLYKTPTAEGITKYGINYRSLTDMCAMHLRAAGKRNLDHMHDGLGLITQHTAMTMEFELSMQSVAPRFAVPYWDFTIDGATLQKKYPGEYFTSVHEIFANSELWQADWFGAVDASTSHVEEGRMAQMTIARDYDFEVHSSRGFLRAPWNVNPSAKVTRFQSICGVDEVSGDYDNLVWPTCAYHLGMTTSTDYETWYDWAWNAGYKPHGPVHSWVGGVGGGDCDKAYSELVTKGYMNETMLKDFKIEAFTRLKNAWRDEVIEVPKYCSEDAPVSECTWTCVEDVWLNSYAIDLLGLSGIQTYNTDTESYIAIAKSAFCDTVYWPGDMFEAASPAEASFWPIHPTMERLLMLRELTNPFTDKTWLPAASGDDDTAACQMTTTGCEGHNAGDLTFWKSTVKETNGAYKTVHLTNEELRHAILPSSDAFSLPYVYNHFKWDHCDSLGVVFPQVS